MFHSKEQISENTDNLTGLLSMTAFRNKAEKYFALVNSKNTYAVIYYDIDNFKFFNERYGFAEGDRVLKQIANSLKELYGPETLMSRFSDDHFVVFASRIGLEEGIRKMHATVHSLQKGAMLELKAGVYFLEKGDVNVSAACDKAKLANKSIKKIYNRDFCYFDQALMDNTNRQIKIVQRLEEAITDGSISVSYQPIIRVLTGKLVSVEALARWNDRELGIINPDEFIPLLEERHLIHKLDCCVISQVCRNTRHLIDQGKNPVPFSINISRMDFQLCDIHSYLDQQLEENSLDKSMLHVEITESALSVDPQELKRHIGLFKQQGFQVWLDDFGSDYSSLNVLKDYDFDVIKIDMKFMRDFENNPKSKIILSSIVDMAKQLGVQTLTEGIETEQQLQFLKNIGCDKAQGFKFGKPIPTNSIEEYHIQEELQTKGEYFDNIGHVNMLSQNPLSSVSIQGNTEEIPRGVPLAILETSKGNTKFLVANEDFVKVLHSIFIETVSQAEELINDRQSYLNPDFMSLVARCIGSISEETMDFIHNGDYCNIQAKCVAVDKENDTHALAVILQNLSRFTNLHKMENMDEMLRFLFTMFDSISIISREESTIEKLYMGSTMFKGSNKQDYEKAINDYAVQLIHEPQRNSFLEFFKAENLWEKISSSTSKYISSFFKTMVTPDNYEWKMYAIIPFKMNGMDYALNCQAELFINMEEYQPILKEISDFFISRVQGLC